MPRDAALITFELASGFGRRYLRMTRAGLNLRLADSKVAVPAAIGKSQSTATEPTSSPARKS
jgi:hypothetical protein